MCAPITPNLNCFVFHFVLILSTHKLWRASFKILLLFFSFSRKFMIMSTGEREDCHESLGFD